MKILGYHIHKRDWKATCREVIKNEERAMRDANQYRNAWQSSRDELAKVRSTLAKTETQMEAARITHERQLEKHIELRDSLHLLIEQLEEQRGVLEGEIVDCKAEHERQLEALHAERKRIEEQAKTTETTYQRILKEKNNKIANIETQRVVAEGRRDELEEENRNLRNELRALEISIETDTAKEYIAELEKENGTQKLRITELETNCDALIDENSEYGAEIDRLRALVDSLQEDELAIKRHSLEDKIKDYEKWLDKYHARRAASQRRRRERIKEAKTSNKNRHKWKK